MDENLLVVIGSDELGQGPRPHAVGQGRLALDALLAGVLEEGVHKGGF